MHASLILCSRDRAARLAPTLEALLGLAWVPDAFELVLVDSVSTDGTAELMGAFARAAPWPVVLCRAERPGLGCARNVGIRAAAGELLVFTDDDCYLDPAYFIELLTAMASGQHDFGAGGVRLFDPADAAISISQFYRRLVIPPDSAVPAGWIHGANFFFLRKVFAEAGMFRDDFGSGTPYPSEDIEMFARASRAGFRGVLLPEAFCHHHHGRRPGTPDLARLLRDYDWGRGGYYAAMLAAGERRVWDIWAAGSLRAQGDALPRHALIRLRREMEAAAAFLDDLLEGRSTLRPPALAIEAAQ